MVKGLLLVVVSALQLQNNLRVLVKPERKELQFSIFSLLCLITLTILPLVNLILSKATKHLALLVYKFTDASSLLCKHIVLIVDHCK